MVRHQRPRMIFKLARATFALLLVTFLNPYHRDEQQPPPQRLISLHRFLQEGHGNANANNRPSARVCDAMAVPLHLHLHPSDRATAATAATIRVHGLAIDANQSAPLHHHPHSHSPADAVPPTATDVTELRPALLSAAFAPLSFFNVSDRPPATILTRDANDNNNNDDADDDARTHPQPRSDAPTVDRSPHLPFTASAADLVNGSSPGSWPVSPVERADEEDSGNGNDSSNGSNDDEGDDDDDDDEKKKKAGAVTMLAHHLPGTYVLVDLLQQFDIDFGNGDFKCPSQAHVGNITRDDMHAGFTLPYTSFNLSTGGCRARVGVNGIEFEPYDVAKLKELFAGSGSDSDNGDASAGHEERTAALFPWGGSMKGHGLSCDGGKTVVDGGTVFIIDAAVFVNVLRSGIKSLVTDTQPGMAEKHARPEGQAGDNKDDMRAQAGDKAAVITGEAAPVDRAIAAVRGWTHARKLGMQRSLRRLRQSLRTLQRDAEQSDEADAAVSAMSEAWQNSGNFLDGKYFISFNTRESSCLFVRKEDAEAMRRLLEGDVQFDKALGQLMGLANVTLNSICDCPDGFPKQVHVKPINATSATLGGGLVAADSADGSDDSAVGKNNTFAVMLDDRRCEHVVDLGSVRDLIAGRGPSQVPPALRTFMVNVTVSKFFQEVAGRIGLDDSVPLGAQLGAVSETVYARQNASRVLLVPSGSCCGDQVTVSNTVLLLERQHILGQLAKSPVLESLPSAVVDGIERVDGATGAYSVHMFRATGSSHGACSYSSSSGAVSLLTQHCGSFKPLGYVQDVVAHLGGKKTNLNETQEQPDSGNNEEDDRSSASDGDSTHSRTDREHGAYEPDASTEATPEESMVEPTATESPSAEASPSATRASAAPSPNAATGQDSGVCFPAMARVLREDGAFVRMEQVRVGDVVLDGQGEWSVVLLLSHRAVDSTHEFVRVETEGGATVVASARHYVETGRGLRTAGSLRVGDQVVALAGGLARGEGSEEVWRRVVTTVGRVQSVRRRGIVAPVTRSGSVAVWTEGARRPVAASCYTAEVAPRVAHSLMGPLRMLHAVSGMTVSALTEALRDGNEFWRRLLPDGVERCEG